MTTTAVAATNKNQVTLSGMFETHKLQIIHALPASLKRNPERVIRMAMTSSRKTPELLDCTPDSFLGAVITCSQVGLEPDTPLGHGWLLPFKNTKNGGKKEVTFMPGYRGYMDLIYRVAHHPILNPVAVFEGDEFEWERGTSPFIKHRPTPDRQYKKLTHAYVTARFADGRTEFDVMTKSEIEAVRARSKATGFSPWTTDYAAMACKSVIRRFSKYLPMSAELQTTIGLDDLASVGESQNNAHWIQADDPIHTKRERINAKMGDAPGSFNPDFDK